MTAPANVSTARDYAKLGDGVTEVLDHVPGHFQVIRHAAKICLHRLRCAITQAMFPARRRQLRQMSGVTALLPSRRKLLDARAKFPISVWQQERLSFTITRKNPKNAKVRRWGVFRR